MTSTGTTLSVYRHRPSWATSGRRTTIVPPPAGNRRWDSSPRSRQAMPGLASIQARSTGSGPDRSTCSLLTIVRERVRCVWGAGEYTDQELRDVAGHAVERHTEGEEAGQQTNDDAPLLAAAWSAPALNTWPIDPCVAFIGTARAIPVPVSGRRRDSLDRAMMAFAWMSAEHPARTSWWAIACARSG
jgi:hypothetical protein